MRLLLVDDDEMIHRLVAKSLGNHHHLIFVTTLAQAWQTCRDQCFDLILLDVTLPDGDGFHFCARLQNDERLKKTPVILLTAKTSVDSKILGFSLGADDYVEKPFDLQELKVRIESKVKKMRALSESQGEMTYGDIRINSMSQRVHIAVGGRHEDVELTPIEYKLLQLMVHHPDMVFTREHLILQVWGEGISVVDRTVDKHISSLRHKLLHCADYVQTVAGSGYKLFVPQKIQRVA